MSVKTRDLDSILNNLLTGGNTTKGIMLHRVPISKQSIDKIRTIAEYSKILQNSNIDFTTRHNYACTLKRRGITNSKEETAVMMMISNELDSLALKLNLTKIFFNLFYEILLPEDSNIDNNGYRIKFIMNKIKDNFENIPEYLQKPDRIKEILDYKISRNELFHNEDKVVHPYFKFIENTFRMYFDIMFITKDDPRNKEEIRDLITSINLDGIGNMDSMEDIYTSIECLATNRENIKRSPFDATDINKYDNLHNIYDEDNNDSELYNEKIIDDNEIKSEISPVDSLYTTNDENLFGIDEVDDNIYDDDDDVENSDESIDNE